MRMKNSRKKLVMKKCEIKGSKRSLNHKALFEVLWNNDTAHIISELCKTPYANGDYMTFNAEKMYSSVDEILDVGVDVQVLLPGYGWIPWYNSSFYTRDDHAQWFARRYPDKKPDPITRYWLDGGDVVGDFVARCRKKNRPALSQCG